MNWNEMFGLSASPIEFFIRGTVMYLTLFLLFRVVIRRRVGAIGMSDLLLTVIIADAAQSGLTGDSKSMSESLIVVGTIFFWNWLIEEARMESDGTVSVIRNAAPATSPR